MLTEICMLSDAFLVLKNNLELNPSFNELIQQKHNAIRDTLKIIDPSIETQLIGSLQRCTRIQPHNNEEFDIDILVLMGNFTGWTRVPGLGVSPLMAMQKLNEAVQLSPRYNAMDPQADQPTITIEHSNNIKIELVPAYRDMVGSSPDGVPHSPIGRGYWVAKDGVWQLADYDYDSDHVTEHNKNTNGWFVPTIKMLKSIRRLYFPKMKSYHLEVIATYTLPSLVNTYKAQNVKFGYADLIAGFFATAPSYLAIPLRMQGSNGPRLALEATELPAVKETFLNIQQHCNTIYQMSSVGQQMKAWKLLFGEPFPSTI